MDEIINKKESIDKNLEQLEVHSPSMRFTKTLVESVKLETDLIAEERIILPWIPRVCLAGFILMSISVIVIFLFSGTSIDASKQTQIAQLFTYVLTGTLGIGLVLGLDLLLKKSIRQ